MARNSQLSYGSQGSEVTNLQELLNGQGYNLATDGIFGSQTQSAVESFQQNNGLTVDGIVGNNTWTALNGAKPVGAPATNADVDASNVTHQSGDKNQPEATQMSDNYNPTFHYGQYQPSESVTAAQAMLDQQLAQQPGQYSSNWQTTLNGLIDKILNREQFSYDLNGDALYQQYKDQFVQQGKMAMMDTMGQAQAMTGGYGNSYAQSVGQQAYQGYLQQLNDKIPELYKLAMDKYQMEGNELYNQTALIGQQEDRDYGRYRDTVSDYYTNRDYYTDRYESERDFDYNKYYTDRDFAYTQFSDDRNYNYQLNRDEIEDQQWQANFDEAKRQFDLKNGGSSGSGSGGSGGSGGGYYSSDSGGSDNSGDTEDTEDTNVPTNYRELSSYLSSGNFDPETIGKLITDAVADGIINQNQAQQLRNAYITTAQTTVN